MATRITAATAILKQMVVFESGATCTLSATSDIRYTGGRYGDESIGAWASRDYELTLEFEGDQYHWGIEIAKELDTWGAFEAQVMERPGPAPYTYIGLLDPLLTFTWQKFPNGTQEWREVEVEVLRRLAYDLAVMNDVPRDDPEVAA